MFIGHYAVGFAAKKWAPKTSLGILVAASIWLDLAWPFFLLFGLENFRITPGITKLVPFEFYDYPLSHSLVMALAWGVLWAVIYLAASKQDFRGAVVVGALVVSHWVLDLFVHKSDLPLLPAEVTVGWAPAHKYGFDLWDHPYLAIPLEVALFVAGIWLYLKSTKALDDIGRVAFWALAVVLAATYAWSFTSTPPNNAQGPHIVAMMGFSQLFFVAWAYWIDDHRKPA